jgi:hypothetical protein
MNASRIRVFPLGHPVEVVSRRQEPLEEALARWGAWPQLFPERAPTVTVEVHEGPAAVAPPSFRTAGADMLLFSDPANLGSFSVEAKSALLRVSRRTLDQRSWFGYHLLQPLVLTGLDMMFFDPLHAACVARGDRSVILAGDSGAGKTTLSYACAKAGWTLISEDGVRLAGNGARKLVGGFWRLRLRQEARTLFPELRDVPVEPTPNGKPAMQLDAAERGLRTAWEADLGPVVFLSRRPGGAAISPFAPEVALAYFLQTAKQPNRKGPEKRISALLNRGCYLLEYEHVDDGVAALEKFA